MHGVGVGVGGWSHYPGCLNTLQPPLVTFLINQLSKYNLLPACKGGPFWAASFFQPMLP